MNIEADPGVEPKIKATSKAQNPNLMESTSSQIKPTPARKSPAGVDIAGIQSSIIAKTEPGGKAPLNSKIKKSPSTHRLGPDDSIGAGDSQIVHGVLSSPLVDNAFELLKEEVSWETMTHRSGKVPRLVAVQGEVDEAGGIPIYRHPADESPAFLPFTPTVEQIRAQIEELLHRPFNHALIQLYRDGIDNISEHSDKVCCFLVAFSKLWH